MAIDGWRVDPAAARRVLSQAASETADFSKLETALAQAISSASAATNGKATATAAALAKIGSDPFEIDLATVQKHVSTAISSTREAVTAYDQGDAQMAAEYDGKVDPS